MSSTHDLPQDRAAVQAVPVAYASTEERLGFLRKVYTLFGGTMVLWAASTYLVMGSQTMLTRMFQFMGSGFLGLILMMAGMFVLLRVTAKTFPLNLVGLGVFGVFMGFLTAPMVYLAMAQTATTDDGLVALQQGTVDLATVSSGAGVVIQAFMLTVAVFGGLTAYALTTKRDFSWMRGALYMGLALLVGIAILSFFGIGESLVAGMGWSIAWVVLMAGFVLYDTQNVMKRYPPNQAASAAAVLFVDFVVMFWHILSLLSRRN